MLLNLRVVDFIVIFTKCKLLFCKYDVCVRIMAFEDRILQISNILEAIKGNCSGLAKPLFTAHKILLRTTLELHFILLLSPVFFLSFCVSVQYVLVKLHRFTINGLFAFVQLGLFFFIITIAIILIFLLTSTS